MDRKEYKREVVEFFRVIAQEIDGMGPELGELVDRTRNENPWFTRESIIHALQTIRTSWLDETGLSDWMDAYELPVPAESTVGVVMAGNIPLVGFHDMMCVVSSGHHSQIKLSSKDPYVLPYLVNVGVEAASHLRDRIEFMPKLKGFDAIIATGSDNSSRYFEYYFGDFPRIIRKNRTSIAVLSGSEDEEELRGLARDMFLYFGMGCRSVSKLFVPEGYNFDALLKVVGETFDLGLHTKYRNNFEYNFSVYAINHMEFVTNDAVIFKPDPGLHPPLSVIFYENYSDLQQVADFLEAHRDRIQCVASEMELGFVDAVPPGGTQQPGLTDYADDVDTMAFLKKLAG